MTITDETLMAYLDNELSAGDKARIAGQIGRSPDLAERLENMQTVDEMLVRSCHRMDSRPLPRGMMALLDAFPAKVTKETSRPEATILPFRKKLRNISHSPLWQMAVAATVVLVVGLGAGRSLLTPTADTGPEMVLALQSNDVIEPDNALFAILDKHPSATSTPVSATNTDITVTPTMTFQTANNEYCREFEITTAQKVTRNIACRGKNAWTVKASVPMQKSLSSPDAQYQTASGPDSSTFDSLIQGMMTGDALSQGQEAEIIQHNWRRK